MFIIYELRSLEVQRCTDGEIVMHNCIWKMKVLIYAAASTRNNILCASYVLSSWFFSLSLLACATNSCISLMYVQLP